MNKPALRLSAAVLTTLIIVVGITAFDHLPGGVRAQIDSERSALASAPNQVRAAQDAVTRQVQAEPDLFHSLAPSQQWPGRFQQASSELQSARSDLDELTRLEKQGHHSDQQRALALLSHERNLRTSALSQATAIQTEAAHWLDRKQHLPAEVQQMERSYQAIHGFDLTPLTAAVEKAEADWPEKKADLSSRLEAVTGVVSRSDTLWQSTATGRQQAASGNISGLDLGGLLAASDELNTSAAALPQKSGELKSLTGQLYDSWDKVLVDMETRGIGSARAYDQKVRTVRTHLGATTSEEKWVDVSPATYNAMRNDLGMAIEHKPAGKYDSEAEHVAQPAGFAYIAPPSQGSNQYGYWDHRDGQSFWVFYGQYALMRDLLFNHSYRPLPRGEWEDYRDTRSRGQTYYGRDAEAGAPKYGSNGTATQERYSGSTYSHNGGFRDSPYAAKSGSYRDSPYASRSAREPESERSGRTFGSNRPSSEPHFRPTPRSAPHSFPSGGGRRFGGRR
ncbi:MAG TPA: hypothetical protein VG096_18525 [Bryobacteraceae bacterium]|jgi:hypothetical protein|nr:hypothetical protein [Bryobacteraceae bacterium]